jgi:cobalt-zinc-cadmium resistance protein CzcA
MLNWIITSSLRHRLVVLFLFLGFVVFGVLSLSYLNIDAFPDTTPVQVQINTVAAALSPEEVERQITFPVEQAISGLPGLVQVRSISKFGLSQIVVTFQDGTDISLARQHLTERVGTVEIPEGIGRPKLGPMVTGLGEVLHYVVKSKDHDLTQLRTLHDWVIRPPLRTVSGAAEINSWGGYEKQYQVRIRPERLIKYGLTWDQVLTALQENNRNASGGNIDRAGEMLLVQGVGRVETLEQIRNIVVTAREGVPVRVGDVADVQIGHQIRRGAVTADGKGEVVLGLGFMLIGENSHDVTRRLTDKLAQVKKTLPAGVQLEKMYDRTELVDHVIDTVRKNLFEGGLLVVAVLLIFLGNLRAGLIVALAIPLSMLFAFSGMLRFGVAASLLSLGALDFGLVVDSSVVLVENVVRHLAHGGKPGQSRIDIVREAAIEVRKPTLYGELIILVVYLPILTLEGVEGKMFRPMALTVIFALAGSLVLSLTLTPVLASLLLPHRPREREPLLVRLLRALYRPVLRLALHARAAVLCGALASLVIAVLLARGLGSEFIPRLSEGALVLGGVRLAGSDLNESIRYNTLIEKALLQAFPDEVDHVWCRIGTAEVATDPMGVEESDLFITLKPRDQWKRAETQAELVDQIKQVLGDMPGQKLSYTQPIEQRVNEMTSGVKADVAIKIFGDDFEVLKAKAREVEEVLRSVPGCEEPSIEQISGQPVLRIRIKQDEVARYGIPAKSVLDIVEAIGSRPVGEVVEGPIRFPLIVRLPEGLRSTPEAIGSILVSTPAGELIPLSRLATIETVAGPSEIVREWGQRRITVQCNVPKRDVGGFVHEARQKIEREVKLPPGRYRIEWGGQFEHLERAQLRLLIVVPVALLLIVGLLYFTYNRVSDVLLVFTGVPFASVGGVLALWLRDIPFSISAGVGFIALSGISVLNSMLLVTFLRQLQERGLPLNRAIEEAALTRLRPVLMTALVASLGFVPMAMSTGMGAEVQRPLATVVIGGVISSTLLTLIVLPVLYSICGSSTEVAAVVASEKRFSRESSVGAGALAGSSRLNED